MTDEQKRIAIAEADGYISESDKYYIDRLAWRKDGQRMATCDLPDYLTDRNAIVGAILRRFKTGKEIERFCDALTLATASEAWKVDSSSAEKWAFATATATKLADAYLAAKRPAPAKGWPVVKGED